MSYCRRLQASLSAVVQFEFTALVQHIYRRQNGDMPTLTVAAVCGRTRAANCVGMFRLWSDFLSVTDCIRGSGST